MKIFDKKTLIAVSLLFLTLTACSPYQYQKEITTFKEGVDSSYQTILKLKNKRVAYLESVRNKELVSQKKPIDFSEGCDKLRKDYLRFVSDGVKIPKSSYSDCYATPQGKTNDSNISNIMAISTGLQAYSTALMDITNASDQNELQDAFSDFNSSTKNLLESINQKLSEQNKTEYDAISNLVLSLGNTILNQERFYVLKNAVNHADPLVIQASKLLEEAAFYLYEKEVDKVFEEMLDYANSVDSNGDYLNNWNKMNDYTQSYVSTIQKSPVFAFKALVTAHITLKKALNNPLNQKQINAALDNIMAFKNSADAALKAIQK